MCIHKKLSVGNKVVENIRLKNPVEKFLKPFGEVIVIDCPYCNTTSSVIIKTITKHITWFYCIHCRVSKDSLYFFRKPFNKRSRSSAIIDIREAKTNQYLFTQLFRRNVCTISQLRDFDIPTTYDDIMRDTLYANTLGYSSLNLYTNIYNKKLIKTNQTALLLPLFILPGLYCGYYKYLDKDNKELDIHEKLAGHNVYTILKYDILTDMVVYPDIQTMFEQYPKDYLKPSFGTTNFGVNYSVDS